MKNLQPDLQNEVFEAYQTTKLSIKELSQKEWRGCLSKKRIQNIVYSKNSKARTKLETQILCNFLWQFLVTKDSAAAIDRIFANQPKIKLSENTIRNIIHRELHNRNRHKT
ncbi:MAG: hypothetical protein LBN27_05115 [Prevotellaceae bacterium]|nr:hypothetical protein [Prevotellaceae bacterium]